MTEESDSIEQVLAALRERAKELDCLCTVEEILGEHSLEPMEACERIIEAIPPGWQYPDVCAARITLFGHQVATQGFEETPWMQKAGIRVEDRKIGLVEVAYAKRLPSADDGPFLKEEQRLIQTIADRIGHFTHYRAMKMQRLEWDAARQHLVTEDKGSWRIVLELLASTDPELYTKITHMMLNHLCWQGNRDAEALLDRVVGHSPGSDAGAGPEVNQPDRSHRQQFTDEFAAEVFRIAEAHLSEDMVLVLLQKWMQQDRLGFLFRAVQRNQPLAQVAEALRRYRHMGAAESRLSRSARSRLRVSLVRRLLSDQLTYIRIAKEYFSIGDFHDILGHVTHTRESHGRLGGKAAGMYLAARILAKEKENNEDIGEVRVPKTWHLSSDLQLLFMDYNNLDEVADQKYKEMTQIRVEYPHIISTCKSSPVPPELTQGLSVALDYLGDAPLVVRSSSVLEDRVGAAFSGKYRSLFVANRGTKEERIAELSDAIAEVYASMFGPDPIEYRAERNLLDFSEEMGIIIQQVVGKTVGPYFFPAFAGVALSRNEFRWSPRIRREDGLVRLVPGLGTRSVDRVGDDYPILFAPGQPNLRVNLSTDDMVRYSPREMDVINLETGSFESIAVTDVIRRFGTDVPLATRIVSVNDGGCLRELSLADTDLRDEDIVVTFEGLMSNRRFVKQAQSILRVLEEKMGRPVDVEFAHDGEHLYLLQCRTQSDTELTSSSPIPTDVPEDSVVFTAHKYVSNGRVPDITHIVYVDPEGYAQIPDLHDLRKVGRAVGRLNKILPKRQFILMGPGRWGSRGDIKLGVNVTYADINNTAVLLEVARRKGQSTPDLSFGTHFFQDLAEARIRYLPLYPDEPGIIFNEEFLTGTPSVFESLVPEFAHLGETIRVIDVPAATDGRVVRVLLNADLDQAMAMLAEPRGGSAVAARPLPAQAVVKEARRRGAAHEWKWRMLMVERIARQLDPGRFGVEALYVLGSTVNRTAVAKSDINLLVHFVGDEAQRNKLSLWLEGWSTCLDEMNYLRTGHRSGGLLDVNYVSDADVEARRGLAGKIDAVTNAARGLPLGGA